MPLYKTRPKAEAYGYCVGILLLDYKGPFVPGDVGNATTYKYPVLYKTVPGATTGKSYTCRVRATNVVGQGLASSPSGAVIVGSPPAPTLTGVTRPAAGKLRVAYTPNGNNGSALTGFTAGCVSANGGATGTKTVTDPAQRAITVTGLTVGKSYTCRVRAINARGTGLPSAGSGVRIP